MEAVVAVEQLDNGATSRDRGPARPRSTDFLAYSRQYAAETGLDQDITAWDPQDFQSFLDWWLLRTLGRGLETDAG